MFKNLKSLFVVEDKNAAKEEDNKAKVSGQKEKNSSSKSESTKTSKPVGTLPSTSNVKGKSDPKFTDKLLKVIEANNQEGFDYLEFKQTLKGMSKMNLDEPTQFMSAYAAAKAMGVTPAKLVSSAQLYIKVLEQEELKFSQTVKAQTEKNVIGRQQQIKDMEAMVEQKEEQIKKLRTEIENDKKKMAESSQALKDVAGKIESTQANFVASYSGLKNQFLADIEKIKQYLK